MFPQLAFVFFKYLHGTLSLPSEEYTMSTLITNSGCLAQIACTRIHVYTHTHKDLFFLSFAELIFLQLLDAATQ